MSLTLTAEIKAQALTRVLWSFPDERYTELQIICAKEGIDPKDLVWFADHAAFGAKREWESVADAREIIVPEYDFHGQFHGFRPEELLTCSWESGRSGAQLLYSRTIPGKGHLTYKEVDGVSLYGETFFSATETEGTPAHAAYLTRLEERWNSES